MSTEEPTGEPLRVICVDCDAPPVLLASRDGKREGYEPEVTTLVGEELQRPVEWVFRAWAEMVPTLLAGGGDVIWTGQAITPERQQIVDFSQPYAIFDETVLVRAGSGIATADKLRGRRVAAIDGTTNMDLVKTFDDCIPVPFDGADEDVFDQMIEALRRQDVDAMVDDDVVTVPLGDEPDLEVGFTVPTRNAWGVAVRKDEPMVREAIDRALTSIKSDGRLASVWSKWMPHLEFPFSGGAA
jgi:polar amino acid transport system substrate-binding protein